MKNVTMGIVALVAMLSIGLTGVSSRDRQVGVFWSQVKIWAGDENYYEAYQKYRFYDEYDNRDTDTSVTETDIPHNQWQGTSYLDQFITSTSQGYTEIELQLWESDWLSDDLLCPSSGWTEIADTYFMEEFEYVNYDKIGPDGRTKGNVQWKWVT